MAASDSDGVTLDADALIDGIVDLSIVCLIMVVVVYSM